MEGSRGLRGLTKSGREELTGTADRKKARDETFPFRRSSKRRVKRKQSSVIARTPFKSKHRWRKL